MAGGNLDKFIFYITNDILYPYKDETRDIQSNITLCLKEFPRANPEELLNAKGNIWPYIPSWVLIRTLYHFNNHKANVYLIILIDNYSVYFLGSVLCNIPLAPRKNLIVQFPYSIFKNDIMLNMTLCFGLEKIIKWLKLGLWWKIAVGVKNPSDLDKISSALLSPY